MRYRNIAATLMLCCPHAIYTVKSDQGDSPREYAQELQQAFVSWRLDPHTESFRIEPERDNNPHKQLSLKEAQAARCLETIPRYMSIISTSPRDQMHEDTHANTDELIPPAHNSAVWKRRSALIPDFDALHAHLSWISSKQPHSLRLSILTRAHAQSMQQKRIPPTVYPNHLYAIKDQQHPTLESAPLREISDQQDVETAYEQRADEWVNNILTKEIIDRLITSEKLDRSAKLRLYQAWKYKTIGYRLSPELLEELHKTTPPPTLMDIMKTPPSQRVMTSLKVGSFREYKLKLYTKWLADQNYGSFLG